jgi:hypothetical protein
VASDRLSVTYAATPDAAVAYPLSDLTVSSGSLYAVVDMSGDPSPGVKAAPFVMMELLPGDNGRLVLLGSRGFATREALLADAPAGADLSAIAGIAFYLSRTDGSSQGKGSLKVRCLPEIYLDTATYPDGPDPAQIDSSGILDVTWPNGVSTVVFTDHSGYYDFGALKPGSYVVAPRYFPATATTFAVVAGEAIERTIYLPTAGTAIQYYLLNPYSPSLGDASLRRALCISVSRAEILAAANAGYASANQPITAAEATAMVPAALSAGALAGCHALPEDSSLAASLLNGAPSGTIELLYNNNAINTAVAAKVAAEWTSLGSSLAFSTRSVSWADAGGAASSGSFQVLRQGWALDSNNVASFFRDIDRRLLQGKDAAFKAIVDGAYAAMVRQDFPAFEAACAAANDYLIDNALALPLYSY